MATVTCIERAQTGSKSALQCSLASSDGKGRCIACDGHELNNAAANGQTPNANGRVPARGRSSSDVADVITGRFASQSGQPGRGT